MGDLTVARRLAEWRQNVLAEANAVAEQQAVAGEQQPAANLAHVRFRRIVLQNYFARRSG